MGLRYKHVVLVNESSNGKTYYPGPSPNFQAKFIIKS